MADNVPKPAAKRRRRNKPQQPGVSVAREGVPVLPDAERFSQRTRDWWVTVWASPMSKYWLDADVPALERLAWLLDVVADGRATAAHLSECRHLENSFGLTPLARRRFHVELERGEAAEGPVRSQDDRWLRAIESD